jgi:hypothetical protein
LPKSSCTRRRTSGTRVEPPTRTTSSILRARSPRRRAPCGTGPASSRHQRLEQPLELRAGDLASVGEAGERQREAWCASVDESRIFAASAASRSSCIASWSRARSIQSRASSAWCRLDVLEQPQHEHAVEVVAAEVRVAVRASTSKIPSLTRRIEMSNVPPPRS